MTRILPVFVQQDEYLSRINSLLDILVVGAGTGLDKISDSPTVQISATDSAGNMVEPRHENRNSPIQDIMLSQRNKGRFQGLKPAGIACIKPTAKYFFLRVVLRNH